MNLINKRFFFIPLAVLSLTCIVGGSLRHLASIRKSELGDTSCLRINFSRFPLTVDPRKTCDYISTSLEFLLYEGLMRAADNGKIEPGLAKSYEVSDDKLIYTFHLREATWSDGSKITSHDFARTWKEILSPDFPSQSPNLLYSIKGAQAAKKGEAPTSQIGVYALDDNTLEVHLWHPTPYFLDLTSFCTLFPTPLCMGTEIDEIANNHPSSFVSSGPFTLKEFVTSSHYTLVKNPRYWDQESVSINTIDISLINDDSTAYNLYKTGKLDLLGLSFSQIPRDAVPSLIKSGQINIVPIKATSMVQFNTLSKPCNNEHFRKALAFAIDRKELCEHITQLGEQIADGLVIDQDSPRDYNRYGITHNPEKARYHLNRALEQMEITKRDLAPLTYLYTPSDQGTRLALAIQQQVKEVLGIELIPQAHDFKVFLDKLRKKDFTCSQTSWILQYNDPMNMLDRFRTAHETTNDTGWENVTYREYLDQADMSACLLKRRELMALAESVFMDELPQIPLFFWNFSYLQKPNIKNIQTTPIGIPIISRARKIPLGKVSNVRKTSLTQTTNLQHNPLSQEKHK